jgi:predicted phage-related endonuclease
LDRLFAPFRLSAQQAAIARFCAEYGHEVVETLVEKETGKVVRRCGDLARWTFCFLCFWPFKRRSD